MLACVLGNTASAFSHLQHAIAHNERADLSACAVRSQVELAKLLSSVPSLRDEARARSLLMAARAKARERNLLPLLWAIDACNGAA
jgi:hypothetical protein